MGFRRGAGAKGTSGSSSTDAYSRVSSVVEKDSGSRTSGHVKVVVRVRPENTAESEGNYGTVIRVLDEHVLIFDPKEESSADFYHGKARRGRDLNKRKKRDVRFAFDRVFDPGTSNKEIYEETTRVILDGLLDGFNCSGKSETLNIK